MKLWLRLCTALAIIAVPTLMGVGLLASHFQAPLSDLKPFWSDELYYTQQTRTFAAVGFNGGYYTVSEQAPRLAYSHYYVWAPFVPMLYALLGAAKIGILGVNVWVLSAGIGIAWLIARPKRLSQIVLFGALLALFPALILLYPTFMQDVLHMAIALIVASGIARLMDIRRDPQAGSARRTLGISLVVFLMACTLLRPTWGLLIFPVGVLADARPSLKRVIAWGGLSATLVLGLALFFQWSSAPYPHFRTEFFENLTSPLDAIVGLGRYFITSVGQLFTEGQPSAFIQRAQIAGVLVVCGISGVVWFRTAYGRGSARDTSLAPRGGFSRFTSPLWVTDGAEIAFHIYNLFLIYLAVIALHEVIDGRDYRVIAPHLLLSLVVMLWRHHGRIVTLFLVSALVAFPQINTEYQADVAPSLRTPDPTYGVADSVLFASQKSAWCNTVSYSFYYVVDFTGNADMLLAFDAGIGLSWINPKKVPDTFKSGYLMLTDDDYSAWHTHLNIEKIGDVQQGAIYRNLDADC